ncbi:MAG TPA: hypothetical protein VHB77_21945 [Planctomycetaceae bacterium]|nr:hypothetical protein [Planctomycetaceae bacterium]
MVREAAVEMDFEIPPLPKPRDAYFVRSTPKPNGPGFIDSTIVEVYRRLQTDNSREKICEYVRNYSLLQTFEPFRQGGREFALISRDYTMIAVLDLSSGTIIAAESVGGFCPVGFYVPDWWDVNDGSDIPGSASWSADDEWPTGRFGFVWGCIWGDDSSWKVQYLDLSRITEGIIIREERFGYVELATSGYTSPCLRETLPAGNSAPPHFIDLSKYNGKTTLRFAVDMDFDIDSGAPKEWRRQKIGNWE